MLRGWSSGLDSRQGPFQESVSAMVHGPSHCCVSWRILEEHSVKKRECKGSLKDKDNLDPFLCPLEKRLGALESKET